MLMPWSNLPQGGGDLNWSAVLVMAFVSLWGGLVNYLGRLRSGAVKQFNVVELIGEFTISSFAGLLVGFVALAFNVHLLICMALAGVAGHAGGRTVYFLDAMFSKKLESLIKKIP